MSMSRWYYWVSGFFLLNAMAAFGFVDRLVYGTWENKPGDKITQSLNLLLILASLALFGRGYYSKRRIGAGGVLALATIAFLFLSAGWSHDPAVTVRQAVVYLFVVLGSIGIAGTLDADEYMDLLRRTCFLSAVASLVLLAVSPSTALTPTTSKEYFLIRTFSGRSWRPEHSPVFTSYGWTAADVYAISSCCSYLSAWRLRPLRQPHAWPFSHFAVLIGLLRFSEGAEQRF